MATEQAEAKPEVRASETAGAAEASVQMCRVCYRGPLGGSEPLVSPCACKGSEGFAHKQCLERWLRERGTDQCDVCRHRFAVRLKPAPLMDFFWDPDHRIDILRMVVDAVSATGDAVVLTFAWVYASGFLVGAGWFLYLLVLAVLVFQTAFWVVVEVIRAMTCYEPLSIWRKKTTSVELLLEGSQPGASTYGPQWKQELSREKKVSMVTPFTTPFVRSSPTMPRRKICSLTAPPNFLSVVYGRLITSRNDSCLVYAPNSP
ncbi:uncharacterized protein LOC144120276 [Amblyomma americanum]